MRENFDFSNVKKYPPPILQVPPPIRDILHKLLQCCSWSVTHWKSQFRCGNLILKQPEKANLGMIFEECFNS